MPVGKKIEATKNKMRENIIAKQKMCQQKKPFQRFVPEFDPLLEKFPKWEIPKQYSLKTILISILTLQNMGIMQCSLLGIFEDTAPTTKVMSLAAFIAIPCGYILYVYITLRGAMKPTMKTKKGKVVPTPARLLAVNVLQSIPANMKPDDLIFKPSIPPELSEPIVLEPPAIPEGASPDEIKSIMEKHAAILKELTSAKAKAIKALGPAALKITGKWICKSVPAEKWMKQYGDLIKPYGPNGYNTVTFAKAKRLLGIVTMCVLSAAPSLAPLQVKMLFLIATADTVMTIKWQPYRDRFKNLEVIMVMVVSGLQILAPILLLAGIIEDQFSAIFMMLMNLIATG